MIELFRFNSRMQPEFYFSSTNTLYCCKGTLLQIHRKQLVFQEISVLDHPHTAIHMFQHILVSVLERKYFLQDHDVINYCFYFQLQRFLFNQLSQD